jgi:hypothetical protein
LQSSELSTREAEFERRIWPACDEHPIPPIAKFETFPWAAAVGCVDSLQLEQVFDDRYVMASNDAELVEHAAAGKARRY